MPKTKKYKEIKKDFLESAERWKDRYGYLPWKVSIETHLRKQKGHIYKDSFGREVLWSGKEHEVRNEIYWHTAIVARAISYDIKIPITVLRTKNKMWKEIFNRLIK